MKITKPTLLIAVALVLAAVGYLAYNHNQAQRALPEGLLQANGRIEGDQITIASKISGRIAQIKVSEGSSVQAGQVLAVLDDAQVQAKVNQAKAAVAAVAAQRQAVETALGALRKQVPLEQASANTGIGQADAMLEKARAADAQAGRDAARLDDLARRGSVPAQRAELARVAAIAAAADVAAAGQGLARSQALAAQAGLGQDRVRAKESELAAVTAQLAQAQATLSEVESVLADLSLKAPSAGVVMMRVREPGEIVAAGSPVLELVDLDRLYVKVYVPELQIGKLRVGLAARIHTDAFPDKSFAATVRMISSRAEFTPKEVQTQDERVKLTYAVKLYLDSNPAHQLTPGVPADAVVRWKDDVEWRSPRW
nr:HlyD family efflux transporter periplasmic adaptor subunit [uncultured Rhodoferax sp.]